MNSAYEKYFKSDIEQFEKSLKSIDVKQMDALVNACENTLKTGHKILPLVLEKMFRFVINLWVQCCPWDSMQISFIPILQCTVIWGWLKQVIL